MKNNCGILDVLDAIFVVSSEACEGKGEDSYCCSCAESIAMAGVFDGCGGLGSRQYDHYEGHTGAYMASRLASGAVYDWFLKNSRMIRLNLLNDRVADGRDSVVADEEEAGGMVLDLRNRIEDALSLGEKIGGNALKLRGSMVRDFPTTAAISLAACHQDEIRISVMWAGDSRVYLLGKEGLMPLSRDDTDGEDAFEDLRNDPVQTNVLSSDGRFVLHSRSISLTEPVVVITATDGYFGYWYTPMEFEYFLLDTLDKAACLDEWKMLLREKIQEVAGDDATLAAMAFHFGTFDRLKTYYKGRLRMIEKKYIQPLEEASAESDETARRLWKEYSAVYGSYLKNS